MAMHRRAKPDELCSVGPREERQYEYACIYIYYVYTASPSMHWGAHRFSLEIAMGSKRLEHIRILFDQLPEMLDPIRDASADNGRNNPKKHESWLAASNYFCRPESWPGYEVMRERASHIVARKNDIARATLRNASYPMKVDWPLKIISVDLNHGRARNSWHEWMR